MPLTEQNALGTEVNKIALRLPPFWRNNIELWFKQVEASFTLSGISSDETKFASLVANIDAQTLNHVSDIILNPPETDKYKELKKRLVSEFADSEGKRIKKLLSELQLGDHRPSGLLRQMKSLAGPKLSDDFLKNLWLQRLPTNIQSILLASSEKLDQLAVLADRVYEVTGENHQVYALENSVAAVTPKANLQAFPNLQAFSNLQEQIEKLTLQVEKLGRERSRGYSRERSARRYRSGSRDHGARDNHPELCFYHERFGNKAQNCRKPCAYEGND